MNKGDKFGRWTVLEKPNRLYGGKVLCLCICGTTRMVSNSNLLTGTSQSCGCLRKELRSQKSKAIQRKTPTSKLTRKNATGYKGVIDMDCSYQVRLSVMGFRTAEEAHKCYVFLKEKAREYQDGSLSERQD